MKYGFPKSILSLVLIASLFGPVAWIAAGYACSAEPILGSICIMAAPKNGDITDPASLALADGRVLQITQNNTPLFALLGTTYGGNGKTTFALPDLRGRMVVGANSNPYIGVPTYQVGAKDGRAFVNLSTSQIPTHNHGLTKGAVAAVDITTLKANTTLTGLNATTTIGTLAANTTLSGLTATLMASSGGTATSDATNGILLSVSPSVKPFLYTNAAPSIAMNSGSITLGGNASTTLSGSPATTITGTPTTTLSGSLGVTISGVTDTAGKGAPVPTMPPYLALYYYIATIGYFPTYD